MTFLLSWKHFYVRITALRLCNSQAPEILIMLMSRALGTANTKYNSYLNRIYFKIEVDYRRLNKEFLRFPSICLGEENLGRN